MNFVELFLQDPATARLDLNQEFDIALQYSIADIRDITKRNAAFSKTIILPGTKNNNYWMGNLFDINADFTFFNPNRKTPCSISVNSEVVMKGFLQLRKIKKLINVDQQGNTILYEVVVFNNAVDLMTELGEKTLNQLDLSELTHTYTKSNIIYSWTQSWTNGWVYPMYGLPNQSSNTYYVTDFYPAYYSKYLLFKIFQEAGFGITGSLLSNPQFEREIIPFVGSGSQSVTQGAIDAENLRVGVTQSFTFSSDALKLPPAITTGYTILANGNVNDAFRPSFTYSLPADNFNNIINPGDSYYDNGNDWNTTTSVWTTSTNRKWAPIWQANYDIDITNNSTNTVRFDEVPGVSSAGTLFGVLNFKLKITHTVEYKLPSTNAWVVWPNGTNVILRDGWIRTNPSGFNPFQTVTEQIQSYTQCDELFIPTGTQVRLRVKIQPYDSVNRYEMKYTGMPLQNVPRIMDVVINYRNTQNYFLSNGVVFAAQELDPIEAINFISAKIKQKDFIGDLIKRYNLYMQVDPSNERLLILDTRPDFYNKVLNLDWTKKKDFSSEDEITLLAELQFKEMLFTMKADSSDNLNKDYTALTGDIYGQYKYTFTNDFVKGQQKIESPFSPTPLVKTSWGAVVPGLSPEDPKVNPRVLYWGGMKNAQQVGFTWEFKSFSQGTNWWTQYPYAGHFDDPFNPTLDIHFGTPQYMYYWEYGVLPTDTMYETYWASYVDQIEDGKLVKSKFYLDEYDVRLIKDNFWAKIFVVDSYYYVNKIIDYKPMSNGLTTVELIKIKEGFAYKKKPGRTASIVRPPKKVKEPVQVGDFGLNNGGIGLGGGLVIGSGNIAGGKIVVGSQSFVNKQLILGDNNSVDGDNSGVIGGSNNIVQGSGNWLLQSSDSTITADGVVGISTQGKTFSEPYSVWMGQGIKGDTINKPARYDRFTKGINLSVEDYNLGQSDWRIIPTEKEVILQTGKESRPKDMTILGHLEIEDITGTYSFGADVRYKQALVEVEDQLNIDGLITVGGELWVGKKELPLSGWYGVFHSETTQTNLQTVNTMSFEVLDEANQISMIDSTKITFKNSGVYNLQFSAQVDKTDSGTDIIDIWFSKNGLDLPWSNTKVEVRDNNGKSVAAWNWMQSVGENDYIEVKWYSNDLDLRLKSEPSYTVGTYSIPAIPSVILTVSQVVNTQVGPSGQNGVSGSSGTSGSSGSSGSSGTSGVGSSGTSGTSGVSGAGTQSLNQTLVIGNTGSVPILLQNGSNLQPSYSFANSTDTGLYQSSNEVRVAADGTFSLQVTNVSTRFLDGSAALPSISFIGDNDTGIFRATGNQLAISAGGSRKAIFSSTAIEFEDETYFTSGSAATPSISFSADTDTGIYRSGTNTIGFSSGGQLVMSATAGLLMGVNGDATTPAIRWTTGQGFYRSSATNVRLAISGANAWGVALLAGVYQTQHDLGTSATPSISFLNDTDTGIYRPAANELGISVGGLTAGVFRQYSPFKTQILGDTITPFYSFRGGTQTGIGGEDNTIYFYAGDGVSNAASLGPVSFNMKGYVEAEPGSAANPGFVFSTNGGIYGPAVSGEYGLGISTNGATAAYFDYTGTASWTRFLLYDVDSGQLQRVSVGAADSGGTGYKVLRIPN